MSKSMDFLFEEMDDLGYSSIFQEISHSLPPRRGLSLQREALRVAQEIVGMAGEKRCRWCQGKLAKEFMVFTGV